MSVTLRQMRYFVSAVETGKLSSAASACGVTQSAITLAVKSLEDNVGAPLLGRSPTGVTLTQEGHRFLRKAREILALVSEATREVEGATAGGVNQGSIRVGATDTVIGYFLGPILARFKARFPRINAQVVQLERPEIESGLIDGELDIAVILVSNLRRREALTSSILLPSQRRLWLPPRHALLAKKQVSLADVAKEPYIMLTVDEAEKSALGYWQRHSLKPDTILRTANVEAVRTMVALGMGVSILSDMVFRPWSLEGDRIEVRDLVEHIPSMDIGLAWRLGATLSPAADEFRAFLQSSYVRPT